MIREILPTSSLYNLTLGCRFQMLDVLSSVLPERTCWILGSGASYDCTGQAGGDLPLTTHIVGLEELTSEEREELGHAISGALGQPDVGKAVTTDLEKTIDHLRGLSLSANQHIALRANTALRTLIKVIAGNLSAAQFAAVVDDNLGGGPLPPRNYAWLGVEITKNPQWSAITLNYDDLLDWVFRFIIGLGRFPKPTQFVGWEASLVKICAGEPIEKADSGIYVKAHGTLGLHSCQNLNCVRYRVPFRTLPVDEGWKSLRLVPPEFPCATCGKRALELILPPGRNKTREEGMYFESAAGLTRLALARFDLWILLGYSVPDYDQDMITLLRHVLQAPTEAKRERVILVINPDAEKIASRLKVALGHDVLPMKATFSEFATRCGCPSYADLA